MLGRVHGIVDGHAWRQARLAHLQAILEGETDEARRAAIEVEIETLTSRTGLASRLTRYWRVRRGGGPDL